MDETNELKVQEEDVQEKEHHSADEEGRDDQRDKYMTFKSGNEYFGLKLQNVSEIIQYQAITAVPETEDYIKGLINLRGKVLPVIDVRMRFHQEPLEYNDRTCIIVINVKSMAVGLIVEKIAEVVEIKEKDILPPPGAGRAKAHHKYVYGIGRIGRSVKLLLDPEKLLLDESSPMEQTKNMLAGDE